MWYINFYIQKLLINTIPDIVIIFHTIRHNASWGKYTSRGIPWKLVYSEEYSDKTSAVKRELEIKRKQKVY